MRGELGGMSRTVRTVTVLLAIGFLLAGCLTTTPKGASNQVRNYSLAKLDVTIAEDVNTGLFERMDDIDDQEFARQFEERLEAALTESLAPALSGKRPAEVLVRVDEMDIASEAGRALSGSQSFIGARVRILDAANGETIAERHFKESEKQHSFTGNIGILVEITKNLVDAAQNDMLEDAVQDFAEAVRTWLES